MHYRLFVFRAMQSKNLGNNSLLDTTTNLSLTVKNLHVNYIGRH